MVVLVLFSRQCRGCNIGQQHVLIDTQARILVHIPFSKTTEIQNTLYYGTNFEPWIFYIHRFVRLPTCEHIQEFSKLNCVFLCSCLCSSIHRQVKTFIVSSTRQCIVDNKRRLGAKIGWFNLCDRKLDPYVKPPPNHYLSPSRKAFQMAKRPHNQKNCLYSPSAIFQLLQPFNPTSISPNQKLNVVRVDCFGIVENLSHKTWIILNSNFRALQLLQQYCKNHIYPIKDHIICPRSADCPWFQLAHRRTQAFFGTFNFQMCGPSILLVGLSDSHFLYTVQNQIATIHSSLKKDRQTIHITH